jgi:hypothetical protein
MVAAHREVTNFGGKEMGSTSAENRIPMKVLSFLGLSALLIAAGWALANKGVAAGYPGGSAQKGKTEGVPALPAPGTYQIDPVHSFVYFGAWHHIVGLVRGRFDNTTGTITVAQDPAACALDVTIDRLFRQAPPYSKILITSAPASTLPQTDRQTSPAALQRGG